jgi:hypothetical protein
LAPGRKQPDTNTVSRGVAHGFHRGQPRCGSAVGNVLRQDLHADGSFKATSHCRFSRSGMSCIIRIILEIQLVVVVVVVVVAADIIILVVLVVVAVAVAIVVEIVVVRAGVVEIVL